MPLTKIIKRSGTLVAFDEQRITNAIFHAARRLEGEDMTRAQEVTKVVAEKLGRVYTDEEPPSVEEVQDIVIATLREMGHTSTANHYSRYRQEHARMREERDDAITVDDKIPYKLLWQQFTWNEAHGCHTVEALNEHLASGTFPGLVEAGEKLYQDQIDRVVEKILRRRDDLRIVIIAGPSSSGKTTTTYKIAEGLEREGVQLISRGFDDYFRNLESHPKDEFGDYDFENPQALDLPLINDHLLSLMRGEAIEVPRYNFKTGKRDKETDPFRLESDQILLIDSLHGLYGPMTASVPDHLKFKVYIEAMCQVRGETGEFVRWADLRMLRRMVRDSWHRSYAPSQTVGHWHYVRRSEMKHIVPFMGKVDHILNGSLCYELSVHTKWMGEKMNEIVEMYRAEPKRYDAFVRAERVANLLNSITPLDDDSCIPGRSLMREYIGGSEYEY